MTAVHITYIRIIYLMLYYILLANVYDGPAAASCHHHSVLESERPIMRPPAADVTAIMRAQAPMWPKYK